MSAPSFSSFPPSFGSFPDIELEQTTPSHKPSPAPGESSQRSKRDKRSGHDRSRRRDKRDPDGKRERDGGRHKEEKDKHNRRDDERLKREDDRRARLGANYEGGTPGLFIIDKAGDPMNVVYGGLHASDIPRYRRVGFGNVLGLGKSLKIITRGTGGKVLEVGINGKRPSARYTDPQSLATLTSTRPRRLLTSSSDLKGKDKLHPDVTSQAEYVRLPSRRGRSSGEPLSSYRSIHTTNDDDVNSDSDASSFAPEGVGGSSSESDAEDTTARTAHQHSLAALEAALQKDPTSLPTWLALLDQTLSTVPPSAKSSLARARAEIKLSVLERAIRTHRKNKASVEMRVKWLNAGAEIWDREKLDKEWDEAVKELGGKGIDDTGGSGARNTMWEEWLRWRIRSAGRATGVEGIIEDARRVIENIDGETSKVKVLWRTAAILKEAGFSERAMGIFQAQAELTFNCVPHLMSEPLNRRLDALEEFWEAEIPRMGESGARGWDVWIREGKPQAESLPSPTQPSIMDVDVVIDPYTQWATDEARLDASCSMPKHADDAGEDPYATILFSDIRPLLIDITTFEAKHALRVAWLGFLGLHIPGFAASLSGDVMRRDDIWSYAHLTRPSYLGRLFPQQGKGKERMWDSYAGTIIAREKSYGPIFGCVKEWGLGVFAPLEGLRMGEGRLWEDVDVSDIDGDLVRRVFEQLREKIPSQDNSWDIMAVAFAAAFNIKSALKLSRTLLSTARDSLPLWGAHARLERMRGKLEEARRIYDTALSTAPVSSSVHNQTGIAELWWAWAEMEWLAGDDSRSREVVFRAIGLDPSVGGAMAVLRARRGLEERIQAGLDGWKEREAWMCLRALLEVLVGGTGAIEDGMEVLERYIRELGLEGVSRESAWTRMLLLGWKHTTLLGRQSKRSAVRDKVACVVRDIEGKQGGTNTVVLGVFLEGEKGESVWGRVRALAGDGGPVSGDGSGVEIRSREKGVSRRVWEVWLGHWERERWEAEVERVRLSLGVGVEEERTRASAILWRIYVEFEIYCKEFRRAKALLFRAVAECPLVKELYLVAFGPLRAVFTPRELLGWEETMAERGIRLHHSLDEYVGPDARKGDESSESESGGEDDLEQQSRDYRRLAPF
ncbi:hypothetical protein K439DRAFT_1398173 [Ramaria rubella]|nr:hypothetical protein K439DRAFT_1398173 [Ramaria rubella]